MVITPPPLCCRAASPSKPSVGLDARGLHHPGPGGDVLADHLGEARRRAGHDIGALAQQVLAHLRRLRRAHHL
ncbi:MAG: hypothetical protein ACK55I_48135, partial [bacterium]